jgi:hypothetical protein
MLSPTYPAKPYFDNENSNYSYFVDVGRQLPNGRMAKLFVLIPGDIESVAMVRIGDSFPVAQFIVTTVKLTGAPRHQKNRLIDTSQ